MSLATRRRQLLVGTARELRHNRVVRFLYRIAVVARHRSMIRAKPRAGLDYLLHSREVSNFSYEIDNVDELVAAAATATGAPAEELWGYVHELRGDRELRERLDAATASHPGRDRLRYGYRYGHYLLARLLKPAVVVELGVHDGTGSVLLARALQRNGEAGKSGRLIGFDLNPDAGWLLQGDLRADFELVAGDGLQTLDRVLEAAPPGLLIQDVSHQWDGLETAYSAAIRCSAPRLAIFGEAGDEARALERIAARHEGNYAEFRERPSDHFWSGELRGIAMFERAED